MKIGKGKIGKGNIPKVNCQCVILSPKKDSPQYREVLKRVNPAVIQFSGPIVEERLPYNNNIDINNKNNDSEINMKTY